jgi:hypothetical protein
MPKPNQLRDYITSKTGSKPEPIGGFEDADEYESEAEVEPTDAEPEEAGDCVSIYLALPMEQRRLILSGDLDAIDEWRDKVGEA